MDVYSFGIVMWELLTGEEPYENMHYEGIIGTHPFVFYLLRIISLHSRCSVKD